jgi:hypothetical protein
LAGIFIFLIMNFVKTNLEIYLPALVDLIDFSDFPWDKIDRLFSEKLKQRTKESKGETIRVEACVYDIIVGAIEGNKMAIGLLDFLNKLFEDLTDTLTQPEKVLVRSNAKSMLKAFDAKYRNFVGEMAVLNNIIKSGDRRLSGIEYKLPNGKSIDFKIVQTAKNEQLLIEIVNIHLDADRVENNAIAIKKFLTNKLSAKMADKKLGLDDDIVIYLVPVLWGGWKEIKVYSDFYKNNQISIENVKEPFALLQYNDRVNYYVHHFKAVSHLFDREVRKNEN